MFSTKRPLYRRLCTLESADRPFKPIITPLSWQVFICFLIGMSHGILAPAVVPTAGAVAYHGEKELELDQGWRFYWGVNCSKDTSTAHIEPFFPTKIGLWTEFVPTPFPSFGQATFLLQITCDQSYPNLAIDIPIVYSAFDFYLNEQLILSSGFESHTATHFERKPYTKIVSLAQGTNDLMFLVSNFSHSKGGFSSPIKIGQADHLIRKRELILILTSFMVGMLTIIGVFFLGMYMFWRKDPAVLYYCLFALCFACRLSHTDMQLFSQVFPQVSGAVNIIIEYLSFYLTWIFFILFVSVLAHNDIIPAVVNIFVTVTSLYALTTLTFPIFIFSQWIKSYVYFGLMMVVYGLYVTARAMAYNRQGAMLMALSYFLIFSGLFCTAMMYLHWIPKVPYLENILLLLSFLMMSLGIAQRFGIAYQTIEKLQAETLKQKELIEQMGANRNRWFVNVAHELRTAITLIHGPIRQFLNSSPEQYATHLPHLHTAERNSARLQDMVHDILDITHLESDHIKLQKQPVSLNTLVEQVIIHFESIAAIKGVEILWISHLSCIVNVDEKRIKCILFNLLSNAIRYTHRGQIILSVESAGKCGVQVCVKDSGDGIAPAEQEKIFDRYYQVTDGHQANTGGSGIGLALARELAILHEGDLRVESEPGMGSLFTLLLPWKCIIEQAQNSETTITAPPINPPRIPLMTGEFDPPVDSPQILIVDDNEDMRSYIKHLLPDTFRTAEAMDGLDALDKLEHSLPDLIICDVMMPRMDGFQLVKQLKSTNHTAHLSIIMLTARADRADKLKTLAMGVNDYLLKPFDEEELLAKVQLVFKDHHLPQSRPEATAHPGKTLAHEQQFLTHAREAVNQALSDTTYGVSDLASTLHLSTRQLHRKLKSSTGMSPLQFIKEIRLQQARTLLENGASETVAEVMYAVGFQKSNYFAKVYKERFGKLPSSYFTSSSQKFKSPRP